MTTGETIKASEIEYRTLYIYRLTTGRFGISGHPVDVESLRDSRFDPTYETLDDAKSACDKFFVAR